MRVLLRHRETKLYVGREPLEWVTSDKAQTYNNVPSAIQAALQHPAQSQLEIFLSYDDPRYDIVLPCAATPPPTDPSDSAITPIAFFGPLPGRSSATSQKIKAPRAEQSLPTSTQTTHRPDSQMEILLPRPPRIVVVDDDPGVPDLIGMVMRLWFKELTFLPFTASTEAWAELAQRDPDLLITDDLMPAMSGQEICRRLLHRKAAYPIIVRSALNATQNWVDKLASEGLNMTFLPIPHAGELGLLRTLVEQSLRKHLA